VIIRQEEGPMKKTLVATVAMLAFVSSAANAQERAGDAALGAVSGAIVLGPIGAVAGAFVGYAAGPSIARSWGLRGSQASNRQRPRGEPGRATSSAPPPAPTRTAMDANGRATQMGAPSLAPVRAAAPAPKPTSAPPIQGFE
jgi:hypothetical protein